MIDLTVNDINKLISLKPVTFSEICGTNPGAVDLYLLFFEAPTAVNGDARKLSLFFPKGATSTYNPPQGFSFDLCYIAVSSTEATLTAVTAGNALSLSIQAGSPELLPAATVVGDLTTATDHLQVWASAVGPHNLRRLDFINGEGADVWVFLYGVDNGFIGNANFQPIQRWKVLNGASLTLDFGSGLIPSQNNQNGALQNGCTFTLSDLGNSYDIGVIAGTSKFRAVYT